MNKKRDELAWPKRGKCQAYIDAQLKEKGLLAKAMELPGYSQAEYVRYLKGEENIPFFRASYSNLGTVLDMLHLSIKELFANSGVAYEEDPDLLTIVNLCDGIEENSVRFILSEILNGNLCEMWWRDENRRIYDSIKDRVVISKRQRVEIKKRLLTPSGERVDDDLAVSMSTHSLNIQLDSLPYLSSTFDVSLRWLLCTPRGRSFFGYSPLREELYDAYKLLMPDQRTIVITALESLNRKEGEVV